VAALVSWHDGFVSITYDPVSRSPANNYSGSPSTSLKEINARLSLVAFFHARPHFRADLCEQLTHAEDATRIVQKFLSGRGGASDLAAVSGTIGVWTAIARRIALERAMEAQERGGVDGEAWASLDALVARMSDLGELSARIANALASTVPAAIGESSENVVDPEALVNEPAQRGEDTDDPLYDTTNRWMIKPE
jgi:DNA mismatch repair ATPase MutS